MSLTEDEALQLGCRGLGKIASVRRPEGILLLTAVIVLRNRT